MTPVHNTFVRPDSSPQGPSGELARRHGHVRSCGGKGDLVLALAGLLLSPERIGAALDLDPDRVRRALQRLRDQGVAVPTAYHRRAAARAVGAETRAA